MYKRKNKSTIRAATGFISGARTRFCDSGRVEEEAAQLGKRGSKRNRKKKKKRVEPFPGHMSARGGAVPL